MRKVALVLLSVLTALPVAAAAPRAGEIGRLQSEVRDERVRARTLRAEAADAAAEVARLERSLAALGLDVAAGDRTLAAQRSRLAELSDREAVLVAQLSQARGRQARVLSALQMMSLRPPPPLLVPADKAVDTVRAAILMQAIAPQLEARASALADRQAEITRVRRLAALGSEALFTAESAQGDLRARTRRCWPVRRGCAPCSAPRPRRPNGPLRRWSPGCARWAAPCRSSIPTPPPSPPAARPAATG